MSATPVVHSTVVLSWWKEKNTHPGVHFYKSQATAAGDGNKALQCLLKRYTLYILKETHSKLQMLEALSPRAPHSPVLCMQSYLERRLKPVATLLAITSVMPSYPSLNAETLVLLSGQGVNLQYLQFITYTQNASRRVQRS